MSTSMRERFGNGHEMLPPTPKELEGALTGYISAFANTTERFADAAFEAAVIARLGNPFASQVPTRLSEFNALWLDVQTKDATQLQLEEKRREALVTSLRAYVHSGYDVNGSMVYKLLKPFPTLNNRKQWLHHALHPATEELRRQGITQAEHQELWGSPSFRAQLALGFIAFPRLRKLMGRY